MCNTRYTAKFKTGAVKQITERGHSFAELSKCLGITIQSGENKMLSSTRISLLVNNNAKFIE